MHELGRIDWPGVWVLKVSQRLSHFFDDTTVAELLHPAPAAPPKARRRITSPREKNKTRHPHARRIT